MKSNKSNRGDVLVRTINTRGCLAFILLLSPAFAYSEPTVFKCISDTNIVNFTDANKTGKWKCEERALSLPTNDKKSFSCKNKNGVNRVSDFDETGEWKCKGLELPGYKPVSAKAKPRILLSIGMSKEEVVKNWGNPMYRPSRTQTRNGITEKMRYPNAVLTFFNGTLEMIQN